MTNSPYTQEKTLKKNICGQYIWKHIVTVASDYLCSNCVRISSALSLEGSARSYLLHSSDQVRIIEKDEHPLCWSHSEWLRSNVHTQESLVWSLFPMHVKITASKYSCRSQQNTAVPLSLRVLLPIPFHTQVAMCETQKRMSAPHIDQITNGCIRGFWHCPYPFS